MAESIRALITANVKATLETITVANGYETDIGTVDEKRSEFDSMAETDSYTLLELLSPEKEDDYQHTEDNKIKYIVYYFNGKNDEKGNDPIQYTDRNVAADIQKALMVDRTRGGYALNTEKISDGHNYYMQQSAYGNSSGSIAQMCTWFLFEVHTLINADNPYQLA
jgi:hypothetical protein